MMGAAAGAVGAGGLITAIGGSMKKKPKLPKLTPIDVAAEGKKAVAGNIENFGLISQLADLANQQMQEQGLSNIDALLGAGTREQITGTIQTGLRGELPKDVSDLIKRTRAEMAGGRGLGGEIGRNLTLRDIGLTSLQRIDQSMDAANRWLSTSQSMIPQFNFGSMFVTPEQAIQQANINQQNTFQRDWLKSQLDAAYALRTIWGEAGIQTGQSLMSMGSMGGGGGAGATGSAGISVFNTGAST